MAPIKNYNRPDQNGPHRREFLRNKRKILATQGVCALCGEPVNKTLRFPDPMSPTIDHIIPIDKGGHPSDISNLQLTHLCCNNRKSDKLIASVQQRTKEISNRDLPLSVDWAAYARGE